MALSRRVICGDPAAGESYFFCSENDVSFPAHCWRCQPDLACLVAVLAVGEWASCELAEEVVEAVDRLHGCGRIEEWGVGERAFGDVDEEPEAVGHVTIERPFRLHDER